MKHNLLFIFLISLLSFGCKDYLDLKPDAKMAVPKTLEHADLLLNDYGTLNNGYPSLSDIGTDDYYLKDSDWKSLSQEDERVTYNWSAQILTMTTQWQNPYKTVYLANQVLDILKDVDKNQNQAKYDKVWGGAHFFRAFAFHQVARNFTLPYRPETAKQEMGIPLRLTPGLDYKSVRSSLEDTYQQIIADYKEALQYLPNREPVVARPHKAAAHAGLARVYLDMQDYEKAYIYAEESLSIYEELLMYEDINPVLSYPFQRFNKEVLFPAVSLISAAIGQNFGRISPDLYNSYSEHDYRKRLYFRAHTAESGAYVFKGSYNNNAGMSFLGLTTSEVYLIKAEAGVRIGKVDEALIAINTLLKSRIDADYFAPITESDDDRLLKLILDERRKELVFRGSRWADLKRLNQDERFKKRLTRSLNGQIYTLEPNSLKYAHLLPNMVITESGMPQNKR
ncbi:RagB/SusD family nutrient uptake outer membrane protein [Sphingobacterium sp. UT-1RO-CII-1]|uniref:RagB/SusD family nutrient uptake outer membrane protein n=1 Tax=Sphingobacterium sp. UT-1RO-CII-1 TaxID=2995225 RepID=UPI00227C0CF7|nr:RagB/SusD family nutrient uptake outer membrane protein [Sphingobacterium sp. UT-1RO-CII-1]MCY4779260.1 RagB/SusD family nutrient uptake outer membrane protein [Sphingobacterium sp. UT-1RO-CII-1]